MMPAVFSFSASRENQENSAFQEPLGPRYSSPSSAETVRMTSLASHLAAASISKAFAKILPYV